MSSKDSGKIRRLLAILLTLLLLGTQTILDAGVWISIMAVPLLPYVTYFLAGAYSIDALKTEVWAMFSLSDFIVGRIIAVIGGTIFVIAIFQWLWYHHKGVGLFKSGLYSKVRHPQFTGIIVLTMGLTIMVMTNASFDLGGPYSRVILNAPTIVGLWFLQVAGYIAIAWFEERNLKKTFANEYKEYVQKVPFLFPLKNPKKIPDYLFTVLIVAVLCVIILVLPYDVIRANSRLIPDLPFP